MDKTKLVTGRKYNYSRPSWGQMSAPVTIVADDKGAQLVRFAEGTVPVRLIDIPADATFSPVIP